MLKKRLIFSLLLQSGTIQLSRNFSLQAVGNLDWLRHHYDFAAIAYSIDELTLLNVGREDKSSSAFAASVRSLGRECFMPISAGGGIVAVDDAYRLLDAGADKLILNSALFRAPDVVARIVEIFGKQCVVGSIDYRGAGTSSEVFVSNGSVATGLNVEQAVAYASSLGVGEIYLTSIDRDGTGQGYDLGSLARAASRCPVPVIASGGVGSFDHFVEGMRIDGVTGASTANIFNFIGDGLSEARQHVAAESIPLARWNFDSLVDRRAQA